MDPAERLADYLAGELDADEVAAIEADLARDPRLRAQIEAMQRADAALDVVEPPAVPAGFESRLRAVLDTELAQQLGTAPGPEVVHDELAERRGRRGWSRMPVLAGAAAAAVLLVGVALVVRLPSADDREEVGMAMDMAPEEESAELFADDADAEDAAMAPPEGPVIVAGDRVLTIEDVDDLLTADAVMAVAGFGYSEPEGEAAAQRWRAALSPAPAPATEADEPADGAEEETADVDDLRALTRGAVDADDLDAIDRCLDELAGGGEAAIPAYIELVLFDGEPAFAFAMVSLDPATGGFTRPEVWVVARSDCQVLHFVQG